jgi:hypothetical protein
VNPGDFPVLFVSAARLATLPLSTGQRIWRHHHRAAAVAIPGVAQVRSTARRNSPSASRPIRKRRRGAQHVARGHPHRGIARQLLDAGRHAERAEAGRRAAGLRPDGQGGRLQQGRGGLAQRFAGQARRGRADLSTASRTTRSRAGSTATAPSCWRSRSSRTPTPSRWSIRCWRSCRRCARRCRRR